MKFELILSDSAKSPAVDLKYEIDQPTLALTKQLVDLTQTVESRCENGVEYGYQIPIIADLCMQISDSPKIIQQKISKNSFANVIFGNSFLNCQFLFNGRSSIYIYHHKYIFNHII